MRARWRGDIGFGSTRLVITRARQRQINWSRLVVIHAMHRPLIERLVRVRPDHACMRTVQRRLMY